MKQAWLIRDESTETHIFGRLVIGSKVLHTIERPWIGNQRSISCIPEENYSVNYLKKSSSGKYRDVYHVANVEGRTGILIHKGNLVSHTTGCLIIGVRKGTLAGQEAVLSSAVALSMLHQWARRESFELNIVSQVHLILEQYYKGRLCSDY